MSRVLKSEAEFFYWVQKALALASRHNTEQKGDSSKSLPLLNSQQKEYLLYLLEGFTECVGYANGRRVKSKTIEVSSEAVVQDLLFFILKPAFPDMTFEDPSPKSAVSYAIKDFYFPSMKLVLEAKYVGSRDEVKPLEKQLADDIWKYSSHSDCEDLIFFIYDPVFNISDRQNFIRKMSRKPGEFKNLDREIQIRTIIKP